MLEEDYCLVLDTLLCCWEDGEGVVVGVVHGIQPR